MKKVVNLEKVLKSLKSCKTLNCHVLFFSPRRGKVQKGKVEKS